jgi:hypothetical protein
LLAGCLAGTRLPGITSVCFFSLHSSPIPRAFPLFRCGRRAWR